jgi:hypothetical protein
MTRNLIWVIKPRMKVFCRSSSWISVLALATLASVSVTARADVRFVDCTVLWNDATRAATRQSMLALAGDRYEWFVANDEHMVRETLKFLEWDFNFFRVQHGRKQVIARWFPKEGRPWYSFPSWEFAQVQANPGVEYVYRSSVSERAPYGPDITEIRRNTWRVSTDESELRLNLKDLSRSEIHLKRSERIDSKLASFRREARFELDVSVPASCVIR